MGRKATKIVFVNNVLVCETLNHDIHFEKAQKILVNLVVGYNGKCDHTCNEYKLFLEIIIAATCRVIDEIYHSEKVDAFIKRNENMRDQHQNTRYVWVGIPAHANFY